MFVVTNPSTWFWLWLTVCLALLPAVAAASSSSDTTAPQQPWWASSSLDWTNVDENYDWEQRDTGVVKEWRSNLGHWSHYNRTQLVAAPPLVPWTQGLMLKSLCQQEETPGRDDAFALYSIYQESAKGGWLPGVMKRRPQDGLYEHGHVFRKTPNRITDMSAMQKLPQHWPAEASTARVTTVCPYKAVVSCPRWLPDDAEQSEELLHGDYTRSEFAELWVNVQENKKVGLFVEYDGVSGELKQVFTCRQCGVSQNLQKKDPKKAKYNLEQLRNKLAKSGDWPIVQENAASKILSAGTALPAFLDKHNWSLAFGRAVQTESAAGPSKATIIQNAQDAKFCRPIPDDEHDLYWTFHCPDGLYFCIPKTFHPTHLDDAVCIELGCVTETDLKRVLVAGRRSEGGLHTTVYEHWCHHSESTTSNRNQEF